MGQISFIGVKTPSSFYPFPYIADGSPALIDLDFENSRFYFNGTTYTVFGALIAAIGGGGTYNNDGTYTLGPNASDLPFPSYSLTAGTFVTDYSLNALTNSTFAWHIENQAHSGSNYLQEGCNDTSNGNGFRVNSASTNQAYITSGNAQIVLQTGKRIRTLATATANAFDFYRDGVFLGADASGSMPVSQTNLQVMLGHSFGAGKIPGTLYRWAYFPSAISLSARQLLAKPFDPSYLASGSWVTDNHTGLISSTGDVLLGIAKVTPTNTIAVESHGTGGIVLKTFATSADDHNSPEILQRASDGKYIAHYCNHIVDDVNGPSNTSTYQRISTNPNDYTAWDAEIDLGSTYVSTNGYLEYSILVELTSGLYHFGKMLLDTRRGPYYAVSTNKAANGLTTDWSAKTSLLRNASDTLTPIESSYGPFIRITKSGDNRIDGFYMDGHPQYYAGSARFMYFDGTNWKKMDGTNLTLPVNGPSQTGSVSTVWDYAGNGNIKPNVEGHPQRDANDKPVVIFSTFDDLASNNINYRRGKWNGSSWDVEFICSAGGSPSPGTQPYYTGGAVINDQNTDQIFASVKDVSNNFDIWRGDRQSNGTWNMTQLTNNLNISFRPYKIPGINKLIYQSGIYLSINTWYMQAKELDV